MDYVLGIDVYSLNSPDDTSNAKNDLEKAANWKAVYDSGVRFAFIKATEFRADAGFSERMLFAKNAGLLRGAYILPHFELDNIADQVTLFIKTVGSDQGELPPVLDLESPGGNWPMGKTLLKKIKDCLDRMENAFGRRPILYTSQSIVRDHAITNPPWGMNYPLWVASYPYFDVANKLQYSDPNHPPRWSSKYPPQPDGYQPWSIWQWTEKGRMNGMGHENVDINMFKGTYADFLKWANAKEPIPVPITDNLTLGPVIETDAATASQVGPGPVITGGGNFIEHVVKPGDALGLIAVQYHTTIETIMAANPQIKNKNIIVDGWVLKIPQ